MYALLSLTLNVFVCLRVSRMFVYRSCDLYFVFSSILWHCFAFTVNYSKRQCGGDDAYTTILFGGVRYDMIFYYTFKISPRQMREQIAHSHAKQMEPLPNENSSDATRNGNFSHQK